MGNCTFTLWIDIISIRFTLRIGVEIICIKMANLPWKIGESIMFWSPPVTPFGNGQNGDHAVKFYRLKFQKHTWIKVIH